MADACINRGWVLHKLGRLKEALKEYNRAILMSPEDPEALYNRGLVLDDMGVL